MIMYNYNNQVFQDIIEKLEEGQNALSEVNSGHTAGEYDTQIENAFANLEPAKCMADQFGPVDLQLFGGLFFVYIIFIIANFLYKKIRG